VLDIFARNPEHKLERDVIAGYEKNEATVLSLVSSVNVETGGRAVVSDRTGGNGPVNEKAIKDDKARYEQRVADLANPPPAPRQIAAV
jgi:indolepyruvate ferredoxin oxidoreductase